MARALGLQYAKYLVIGAGQKMYKNFRVRYDRMFAHSVNPQLQLFQPQTDKIVFKPTCGHNRLTALMYRETML